MHTEADVRDWWWFLTRGLAALSLLFLLVFAANEMGLLAYRAQAPRVEAARRQVWEQSPSHVNGMRQRLARLKGEWMVADGAHREALCFTARHEASTVNLNDLPEDIRQWECVK